MHVHSNNSDGKDSVKSMADECRRKGIDGFALTDHDTIKGLGQAKKITDILIIPGIEITTRRGHVLGLGVSETVPKLLSVEETIERIHEQGGLAVSAHPLDFLGKGVSRFNKYKFDAIEVLNAHNLDWVSNTFARKRAEGYAKTGGTDSHNKNCLGTAYTTMNQAQTIEDVLRAIKKRKTETGGRVLTPQEYVRIVKDNAGVKSVNNPGIVMRVARKVIEKTPQEIAWNATRFIRAGVSVYNYARIKMLGL